jgi:hypothetical protein
MFPEMKHKYYKHNNPLFIFFITFAKYYDHMIIFKYNNQ